MRATTKATTKRTTRVMASRARRSKETDAECAVPSSDLTVGVDLGDRISQVCVLDSKGEIVEELRVATTRSGLTRALGIERVGKCRIAVEVGTHSPWVSRLLAEMGHEVLVANARKLRFIYQNRGKTDRVDARSLARVARMDPALLSPVKHRGEQVAQDLALLRTRDLLVRTRVKLIGHARGAVKTTGHRLKASSTRRFTVEAGPMLPEELKQTLAPVLCAIDAVSEQIRALNVKVRELAKQKYPETDLLRQVSGVGFILSLAYVLTLERAERFERSRMVGPYLGLVPGRRQSGNSDPQLRITKEGDNFVRRLLVQGAQYILGPFGPDCDLRRFGMTLEARGGKYAKKRAIVAVARKLAVLLHRLWRSGEVYEPIRNLASAPQASAA
jgi:transposase